MAVINNINDYDNQIEVLNTRFRNKHNTDYDEVLLSKRQRMLNNYKINKLNSSK